MGTGEKGPGAGQRESESGAKRERERGNGRARAGWSKESRRSAGSEDESIELESGGAFPSSSHHFQFSIQSNRVISKFCSLVKTYLGCDCRRTR